MKNDSNTNIGTEAYYKRLETFNNFTIDKKESILKKSEETKIKNETSPKQKFLKDEVFGFVNVSKEKRKLIDEKIKSILNKRDENNIKYIELICRKRVEKMRKEGKLIQLENLPDFYHYLIKVRRYSEKIYKQYVNIINPLNLKRSKKDYHLDHKFSIKDGF